MGNIRFERLQPDWVCNFWLAVQELFTRTQSPSFLPQLFEPQLNSGELAEVILPPLADRYAITNRVHTLAHRWVALCLAGPVVSVDGFDNRSPESSSAESSVTAGGLRTVMDHAPSVGRQGGEPGASGGEGPLACYEEARTPMDLREGHGNRVSCKGPWVQANEVAVMSPVPVGARAARLPRPAAPPSGRRPRGGIENDDR